MIFLSVGLKSSLNLLCALAQRVKILKLVSECFLLLSIAPQLIGFLSGQNKVSFQLHLNS